MVVNFDFKASSFGVKEEDQELEGSYYKVTDATGCSRGHTPYFKIVIHTKLCVFHKKIRLLLIKKLLRIPFTISCELKCKIPLLLTI